MSPTLEPYALEIAAHADDTCDTAACRALWRAVIRRAIEDAQYIDQHSNGGMYRDRRRAIEEFPPEAFFGSAWFEEICESLGVDPAMVLARVDGDVSSGSGAKTPARNVDAEPGGANVSAPDPLIGRRNPGQRPADDVTRSRRGAETVASPGARQYPDPPDAELWDADGRIYHETPAGELHDGAAERCGECAA